MQERTYFQGDVTFSVRGKAKTKYLMGIENSHPEFLFHSEYNGYLGGRDVLTLTLPDETLDDPIDELKEIIEDAVKNGVSVNGKITYVEQESVTGEDTDSGAFNVSSDGQYIIRDGKVFDFPDEDGTFECNDGLDDDSPMPETRRIRTGERGALVSEVGDAIFEQLVEKNNGTEVANPVGLHNGLEDLVDDTIGEYYNGDEDDFVRLKMSTIDGLVIPDILDGVPGVGRMHFKPFAALNGKECDELGNTLSDIFRKHKG